MKVSDKRWGASLLKRPLPKKLEIAIFFHWETSYNLPNLLNCFDKEFFRIRKNTLYFVSMSTEVHVLR